MSFFNAKNLSAEPSAPTIGPERIKELIAQADAESDPAALEAEAERQAFELADLTERAANGDKLAEHRLRVLNSARHAKAPTDPTKIGITQAEADQYKREWERRNRRLWDYYAKKAFLSEHFILDAGEKMPIPESTTHHADILAARARVAAAAEASKPKHAPKANRLVAVIKAALGIDEESAPVKPRGKTFFE